MMENVRAVPQVNGDGEIRHCTSTAHQIKISDLPILQTAHCRIKDPERVERIINNLISGGAHKLQVVSDFDYTITKQRTSDGEDVLTSFGMFNACQSLPKHYLARSLELYDKYRPMEIDPHLSLEEKMTAMIEWWSHTSQLLRGFSMDKGEIDEVAKRYKNALRDGTHEMFRELCDLNVPLLVFSAGLGDSVLSVLNHANVMYPNVKVISNFLQYDGEMLNGLQDNMIHTYSKNETALKGTEYYDLVHDRDHVIVMGDSLGDACMADGVPSSSNILKIGFLFHHVEDHLPSYMDAFDIVLIDDQTMDLPREIISLIAKASV